MKATDNYEIFGEHADRIRQLDERIEVLTGQINEIMSVLIEIEEPSKHSA